MGTVRFTLRTDKINNRHLCPIELVYQISGQRKYFGTGIKVFKVNWHIKDRIAIYAEKKTFRKDLPGVELHLIPTSKEIELINANLMGLRKEVSDIEKKFELSKVVYSAKMVVESLSDTRGSLTKTDQPSNLIYEFIEEYIQSHKATREIGSLRVYGGLMNHLKAFESHKRRRILFESIDYSFFQEFQNFLISSRGLNNTSTAKQLSTLKTFLSYAKKRGVEISDKYRDFKVKRESLEVIALTEEEFESLFRLDLAKNRRLAQVRDVFCFACATGLRYSDLNLLRWEHIKGDEIKLVVKKTKEMLVIPLNKYSTVILARYKDRQRPLPVISNQKMNLYLKGWDENDSQGSLKHYQGLCELAGIIEPIEIVRFRGAKRETNVFPKYKLIGVHTGRKTFATLSLEKGMSAEEVMAITGHKDYRSFKRYVIVTEKRKKVVMKMAWGEAKLETLKVV
jgi:integrase